MDQAKRTPTAKVRGGFDPASGVESAHYQAAMAAHARADYATALENWAQLRAQASPSLRGFMGAIGTAKAAERHDLVASLLREGQAALPRHAKALARYAEARAWEAEDTRWHRLMKSPPGDRAGELEAALAPLADRNISPRPVPTVLARLDVIKARFPRYVKSYVEELGLLLRMGEYEQGLARVGEYRKLFPSKVKLALAHAAFLDALQKYDEAFVLIAEVRKTTTPPFVELETAHIHALSQLGRLEEAEADGAAAMAKFPDNADLAREYAAVASRRADWLEALKRLQDAAAKWPGDTKIKKRLNALRQQMPDLEVPPSQKELDETATLFARFESLGGSAAGCEFGVVQRNFGSSALGLLRWTAITMESLATGIRNGFEGLTEPENVYLKTYRSTGEREEYMVEDHRYGFNSHTFIAVNDAPADKLLVQTLRRLAFLRDKLIEDFRESGKIFVYKSTVPTSEEVMLSVRDAIRSQGPSAFLCVVHEDAEHAKGTIRQLADGLFVGYAQYFMWETPPAGAPSIDRATWKSICTQVAERIDAAEKQQAA